MTKKAVALISGGLDSLLAAKVVQNQGVRVEGLMFQIGFAKGDLDTPPRSKDKNKPERKSAAYYAEKAGIKLHVIDVFDEFMQVLIDPKRGYGGNLNPCIDCKSFMMKKAKIWMEDNGFDFLVSGEVVGQRPMSQRKEILPLVAKDADVTGLILRPLSAKIMPETIPEKEGWVYREKLYDFNGRNRKPQMALAKELGIDEYPQPAGGCLLTEEDTANKIKDLWDSRGKREYTRDDIRLIAVGRHLRPASNYKLIIARDNNETQYLKKFRQTHTSLVITSHPGPIAIADGELNESDITQALQIVARFGKGKGEKVVSGEIMLPDGTKKPFSDITPYSGDDIKDNWYI